MSYENEKEQKSVEEIEDKEWIESLEAVLENSGPGKSRRNSQKTTDLFPKSRNYGALYSKYTLYKYNSCK